MRIKSVLSRTAQTPFGTISISAGDKVPLPAGGEVSVWIDMVELAYEVGEFDLTAFTGFQYSTWQDWAAAANGITRLVLSVPSSDFRVGDAFLCANGLHIPIKIVAVSPTGIEIERNGLHTGTNLPQSINYYSANALVIIQDLTGLGGQVATFGDSPSYPDLSPLSLLPFSTPHANHLVCSRTILPSGLVPAIDPPQAWNLAPSYPSIPYKRFQVAVPHIYSIRNGFDYTDNIARPDLYPKQLYINIYPYEAAQTEVFEVITDYPNRSIQSGNVFSLVRPTISVSVSGLVANIVLSKPPWVSGSYRAFAFLLCDEAAHGTGALPTAVELIKTTQLADTPSGFVGSINMQAAHLGFSPKVVGCILWESGGETFTVYSDPYEIPITPDDRFDYVSTREDVDVEEPYRYLYPYDGMYVFGVKFGVDVAATYDTEPEVEARLYGVLPSGALELLERYRYKATEYSANPFIISQTAYSPYGMEMMQKNTDGTYIHRPSQNNKLGEKAEVVWGIGANNPLRVHAYMYARRFVHAEPWVRGANRYKSWGDAGYLSKFSAFRVWLGYFGRRVITGHRDCTQAGFISGVYPYSPLTQVAKADFGNVIRYNLPNRPSWRITLHANDITTEPIAQVYSQTPPYLSPNDPTDTNDPPLTYDPANSEVFLDKTGLPDGRYIVYFRGEAGDYNNSIAEIDEVVISRGTEEVLAGGEAPGCCYKMPVLGNETVGVLSRELISSSPFLIASYGEFHYYKGQGGQLAAACLHMKDFCGVEVVDRIPEVFVDIVGVYGARLLGSQQYVPVPDLQALGRFMGSIRRVGDEVETEEYITIAKRRKSIYRQYRRRYEIEVVLPSPCAVNHLDLLKLADYWVIQSRNRGVQVSDTVIPEEIDFTYRDGLYIARITAKQVIWGDEMRYLA